MGDTQHYSLGKPCNYCFRSDELLFLVSNSAETTCTLSVVVFPSIHRSCSTVNLKPRKLSSPTSIRALRI